MRLFFLSLVVALSGCATTKFNIQPSVVDISFPKLNEINTVNVGDTLIGQGKKTKVDVWQVTRPFKVSIINIGVGEFLKIGEDEQYYYVRHISAPHSLDSIRLRKNSDEVCYIGLNKIAYCGVHPEDQIVVFKEKNILDKNSFQKELIYNGKVGNKINIGYREFFSDVARPAFNNNVEYDLSDSKIINYKGALIEVLDVGNQGITYKVLRNFNNSSE